MRKLLTLLAFSALATNGALAQSGNNGAKVGKNGFLLNVNAYERCPSGDFLDSNRHMIAVQANLHRHNATDKTVKLNKIFLQSGDDFWVEDGNACEDGAYFHLPITGANCSNCGDRVAAGTDLHRIRGESPRSRQAGRRSDNYELYGSVHHRSNYGRGDFRVSVLRRRGNIWVGKRTTGGGSGKTQNRWENVSSQLLTVCIDTDMTLICDDRVGLFDEAGEDYWWNWDTKGRPHVQLVFFPVQAAQ